MPGIPITDRQVRRYMEQRRLGATQAVAESCGYLPLALAGGRVRGGGRWEDVRAALERSSSSSITLMAASSSRCA